MDARSSINDLDRRCRMFGETCLVVAFASLDNIKRDRCAYEWKQFCQEWSCALKPSNTVIIPVVASDINPEDLPRATRAFCCAVPARKLRQGFAGTREEDTLWASQKCIVPLRCLVEHES
jgi:hypothetical protein